MKNTASKTELSSAVTLLSGKQRQTKEFYRLTGGAISVHNVEKTAKFSTTKARVDTPERLFDLIRRLEHTPHTTLIRGALTAKGIQDQKQKGRVRRLYRDVIDERGQVTAQATFRDTPRSWACIDIDEARFPGDLTPQRARDRAEAIERLVQQLPAPFREASYVSQLSSSMGVKSWEKLKVHLWFLLSDALTSAQLKRWSKTWGDQPKVDRALFHPIQLHYTAAPLFRSGLKDPIGAHRTQLVSKAQTHAQLPIEEILKLSDEERLDRVDAQQRAAARAKLERTLSQRWGGEGWRVDHNTERGERVLDKAAQAILQTSRGERHQALVSRSYWVGRWVGAGALSMSTSESILLDAAMASGLDRREAVEAIKWGIGRGERDPIDLDYYGAFKPREARRIGRTHEGSSGTPPESTQNTTPDSTQNTTPESTLDPSSPPIDDIFRDTPTRTYSLSDAYPEIKAHFRAHIKRLTGEGRALHLAQVTAGAGKTHAATEVAIEDGADGALRLILVRNHELAKEVERRAIAYAQESGLRCPIRRLKGVLAECRVYRDSDERSRGVIREALACGGRAGLCGREGSQERCPFAQTCPAAQQRDPLSEGVVILTHSMAQYLNYEDLPPGAVAIWDELPSNVVTTTSVTAETIKSLISTQRDATMATLILGPKDRDPCTAAERWRYEQRGLVSTAAQALYDELIRVQEMARREQRHPSSGRGKGPLKGKLNGKLNGSHKGSLNGDLNGKLKESLKLTVDEHAQTLSPTQLRTLLDFQASGALKALASQLEADALSPTPLLSLPPRPSPKLARNGEYERLPSRSAYTLICDLARAYARPPEEEPLRHLTLRYRADEAWIESYQHVILPALPTLALDATAEESGAVWQGVAQKNQKELSFSSISLRCAAPKSIWVRAQTLRTSQLFKRTNESLTWLPRAAGAMANIGSQIIKRLAHLPDGAKLGIGTHKPLAALLRIISGETPILTLEGERSAGEVNLDDPTVHAIIHGPLAAALSRFEVSVGHTGKHDTGSNLFEDVDAFLLLGAPRSDRGSALNHLSVLDIPQEHQEAAYKGRCRATLTQWLARPRHVRREGVTLMYVGDMEPPTDTPALPGVDSWDSYALRTGAASSLRRAEMINDLHDHLNAHALSLPDVMRRYQVSRDRAESMIAEVLAERPIWSWVGVSGGGRPPIHFSAAAPPLGTLGVQTPAMVTISDFVGGLLLYYNSEMQRADDRGESPSSLRCPASLKALLKASICKPPTKVRMLEMRHLWGRFKSTLARVFSDPSHSSAELEGLPLNLPPPDPLIGVTSSPFQANL